MGPFTGKKCSIFSSNHQLYITSHQAGNWYNTHNCSNNNNTGTLYISNITSIWVFFWVDSDDATSYG